MNGDAKYVEPKGKSLEVARNDLQDVRAEMASLGLSILSSQPEAQQTATQTVIDFSQESSQLETIVRSGRDAIESCLGFHAAYIGHLGRAPQKPSALASASASVQSDGLGSAALARNPVDGHAER